MEKLYTRLLFFLANFTSRIIEMIRATGEWPD